jgi:hypothetical protein
LQAANLADLQITNCLGEGGFAKVFRGLWRGLVVGIKVGARSTGLHDQYMYAGARALCVHSVWLLVWLLHATVIEELAAADVHVLVSSV